MLDDFRFHSNIGSLVDYGVCVTNPWRLVILGTKLDGRGESQVCRVRGTHMHEWAFSQQILKCFRAGFCCGQVVDFQLLRLLSMPENDYSAVSREVTM